jgi:hypothetical protein
VLAVTILTARKKIRKIFPPECVSVLHRFKRSEIQEIEKRYKAIADEFARVRALMVDDDIDELPLEATTVLRYLQWSEEWLPNVEASRGKQKAIKDRDKKSRANVASKSHAKIK